MDDEIESILYIGREVSVYKIPPLKANEGHKANDWGDLANPLWKGRLRIVERSETAVIYFEDGTTVFAKTEYDPSRPSVEAVLDSSRYFVVRVEDAGKKAYIGMGFIERTDSFDFNVALQDYTKRYRAKRNPLSHQSTDTSQPPPPKKDYSLKEGQTFSIQIPGRTTTGGSGSGSRSSSSSGGVGSVGSAGGGAVPLLPPPPSAKK
ncbi:hypothetical protein AMATHDRAFT_3221 [Amanita thiersii Skay4041]|uniref:NECAP PHear domain-containing protein n=1 Tax=Amanita thiersii Skay4041 TaxID=703135 RepID=A0A2A9NKY4_9AGAR|nr:hypothetical protein AMATHDRAFT_3221 [Amanita thiersii Skay4041]